jgi:hypothetical protein
LAEAVEEMTRRSVERVASAVRLLLTVQARSGFIQVYIGVAVATVIAVRLLIPVKWATILVPAVLLGEYGTMGVFLVAAQRFLERNEKSTTALAVTPLGNREQVVAMILAPGLVATVAGTIVFAGILGVDERLLFLLAPLFLTAFLAGCVGLILSCHYDEFTRFIMGAIPVVTVFSLPFLSYFDLTPRWSFAWLPWDAALFSFSNLAGVEPRWWLYLLLIAELVFFSVVGFMWAERDFRTRVRERLEAVA